ncbi:hypothetical protein BaRGS_00026307 [Batillaria attramentaria]|uniref:Uncharacterized protein n=1 Tax=Batillaria attramentaria TaxID=370345 RepID=A0ABD0K6S1_9CAEN
MKVSSLNAVISASHFNLLVSAVKDLAGFDANEFQNGHLAMRLGHSLKKCSHRKQSEATKQLGQGSDDVWQDQLREAQQLTPFSLETAMTVLRQRLRSLLEDRR